MAANKAHYHRPGVMAAINSLPSVDDVEAGSFPASWRLWAAGGQITPDSMKIVCTENNNRKRRITETSLFYFDVPLRFSEGFDFACEFHLRTTLSRAWWVCYDLTRGDC